MKKITYSEVKAYDPPGHHGMVALKLQGREFSGSDKFWCGLSHFLPNGGADWAYEDSPTEKVYFVVEGEITVKSKDETIILKKFDSIHIPPFEGRSMINHTNLPTTVLVAITYPD